jgi:hypothetical protein
MRQTHSLGPSVDAAGSSVAHGLSHIAGAVALMTLCASALVAQKSAGPANGTLLVARQLAKSSRVRAT